MKSLGRKSPLEDFPIRRNEYLPDPINTDRGGGEEGGRERMITPENINRVGGNHPSRIHNPVGGAMKKSFLNLTAQTPRFRHKDHDSDIKARKCHSTPEASHQPLSNGI